ncbi:S1 family peptidase [Streptomyces sp. NPDC059467]|uniref:S1 family peptidase n=1 Tax=Streptomyces sp. NPDC059467 TaxID=3346844 RepID=UPI00368DA4FE
MAQHHQSRRPDQEGGVLTYPRLVAWVVLVVGLLAGGSSPPAGRPAGGDRQEAVVALVNASSPRDNLFNGQFCGGVLVADDLVLTAAHCVRMRRPGSVDAVVGADNLCRGTSIQGRRLHVVRTVLPSRTANGTADAALLVLAAKVRTTPAGLPSAHDTAPERGTAFGWGRNGYGGVAPCRRTSVPLRFVAQQRCTVAQRNIDRTPHPGEQLCAVPGAGATRNTCTGDSGSPVLTTGDHATVVGLVSWGPSCRIDDVGVYVRVASLRHWIDRVVQGELSVVGQATTGPN